MPLARISLREGKPEPYRRVNTSRPGRRRWGATEACGNRSIRTKAYRQRQKERV